MDLPKGARQMSDTEIGDEWVDAGRVWRWTAAVAIAVMGGALLLGSIHALGVALLLLILPMWFALRRIDSRRGGLAGIALSEGHPWHDAETTGQTTVHVRDIDDAWQALPARSRLVPTEDPLLGRILLREGDVEGPVLVRWSKGADRNLIPLINMAQALADAQDREVDAEDPIEAARAREASGDSLLEREWEETEAGSIEYKPGALIRRLNRPKDDD